MTNLWWAPLLVAAAAPPPHGAELEALRPWIGVWRCDASLTPPGGGAAVKGRAAIIARWELGGFWIPFSYRMAKPAFEGRAFIGYDTTRKQYVYRGVDSAGGWIDLSAPSASRSRISWSGTASIDGQAVPAQLNWSLERGKLEMRFTANGQLAQVDVCRR